MVGEYNSSSIAGLVVAGGMGTRLGLGPKAFLKLDKETLLKRVVSNLSGFVDRILVGVPSGYLKKAEKQLGVVAEVYPGGKSRQETIKLLFQRTKEEIIVIYDLTRPFASKELLRKVIETAHDFEACGAFINSSLPVFLSEKDFAISSIPKDKILIPQSPQAFRREILERAFEFADINNIEEQTLYELVLKIGVKVYAVMGEETNIKITTPLDWEIAKKVILPIVKRERRKNGK